MAGEYNPRDGQDLNNLTSSIIPSNSYLSSWNQAELTPRAENQSFQAGFNLFSPQGNYPNGMSGLGTGTQSPAPAHDLGLRASLLPVGYEPITGMDDMDERDGPSPVLITPSSVQSSNPFNTDTKMRAPASQRDISTLKAKAMESLAVKRGNSVRSTSQESRPGIAENPALKAMQFPNIAYKHPGLLETPIKANKPIDDSTSQSSKPSATNGNSNVEMSTEIDNLVAEGRAAASNGQQSSGLISSAPKTELASATEAGVKENALEPGEVGRAPVQQMQMVLSSSVLNLEHVSREEVDEIDYWLNMTGYYDKDYRDKLLTRRRRLKEIEDEREKLIKEEQEDNPFRSPFRTRADENKPAKSETKAKESAVQAGKVELGIRIKNLAAKADSPGPHAARSGEMSLKRHNEDAMDVDRIPLKLNRTESTRANQGPANYRNARSRSPVRRDSDLRNRTNPPDHRDNGDARGSGSRREAAHHRQDSGTSRPPTRTNHNDRTRFFLLKSWNLENIEAAQTESTWATQTKNEQLFVDAYKTSKNVVFFFSANHSKSFQGYARMESLPGARGVPEPSWVQRLHWPTTEPFGLKWIRTGDTPYRMVGDLKNRLNEGLAVFVGRDGQEIPEDVGYALCDAIDEHISRRRDYRR